MITSKMSLIDVDSIQTQLSLSFPFSSFQKTFVNDPIIIDKFSLTFLNALNHLAIKIHLSQRIENLIKIKVGQSILNLNQILFHV